MGGTSSAWFALCDSYCLKCSLATKLVLLIIACAVLGPTSSQRTRREGTSSHTARGSLSSVKLYYCFLARFSRVFKCLLLVMCLSSMYVFASCYVYRVFFGFTATFCASRVLSTEQFCDHNFVFVVFAH